MIDLASLWIGDSLSPIEQASAISFLRQGHKLYLYVLEDVKGVPPGVIIRDAREVLNTQKIIRHAKTGSPALHSDLFRYALLERTDQMWVDLDLIACKPLSFHDDYVFGYESEHEVNGAVLKLPKNSPALVELLKYKENTRGYPPMLKGLRKFRYLAKSFGQGLPIEKWPWGSIGPRALTHFLRSTGEISKAQELAAFYPVPFEEARRFIMPGEISPLDISSDTYAVHLWGNSIRKILKSEFYEKIPADSYLGITIQECSNWCNYNIRMSMI